MKKIMLIIAIALFSISNSWACEICGCSHSNYYIGLLPQFRHKFIGIRYQYKQFRTVMADEPTQFSRDYFKTVELWGGWNIGKKWQVLAVIPYTYIHQVSDDGVVNNQGIGDIAAMVNYKVFNKRSVTAGRKEITQQLWFGAGVKAPTGKFRIDETDPAIVAIANTQTGTSSTDFMLNGIYNISINKFGINTSASYKINTTGHNAYAFGNKFSVSSLASYTVKAGNFMIVPNAGLLYENSVSNRLGSKRVAYTGGDLLTGAAGVELNLKGFTLGANMQFPLTQHFASGQTELKSKGMVHLSFAL